jgi:transcriptional regulator with XRE-family HTH domain
MPKNGTVVKRAAVPVFPLRRVMEREAITLAELAVASGVAYTTLAALARGASRPDWGTLLAISRALNVPLCIFHPNPTKESKHVGYD